MALFSGTLGDLIRRFRRGLSSSTGASKILENLAWLFFDRFLRMGVGLVVGLWVARYLGPEQFGAWNYAIAFAAFFGAFAGLGLDNIVVRNLVREPDRRDEFLGTAFWLKLGVGMVATLLSIVAFVWMEPENPLALPLIALSSIGIVFQSFGVIDFHFQSRVQSKYTVYAQNLAFLLVAVLRVVLVKMEAPLLAFAFAGAFEMMIGATFLVVVFRKYGMGMRGWRFRGRVAIELLRDSWPLVLTGLAAMVYMRIDQVMIGNMLGNREVGLFSAAVRISEIWYFVPMAIVSSFYPAIVEARSRDGRIYMARLQTLNDGLFLLGLVVAIGMSFASAPLVRLLYGSSYEGAGPILVLHVWTGVAICVGAASSCWTLTENVQRVNLYKALLGCGSNVLLNLWLIPKHGVQGAAVASVVAQCLACFSFFDRGTFAMFRMQMRSLNVAGAVARISRLVRRRLGGGSVEDAEEVPR